MDASIIDYIGKYEGGILVSVGLMYESEYYDAIFYYTADQMIINVDEKLETKLGYSIEQYDRYYEVLESIIKNVDPYELVYDKLEEVKF